jgi:PST family polysaccharide transporter
MTSTAADPAVVTAEPVPAPEAQAGRRGGTYHQILKNSAWIGGSSVVTIGFNIVRTKAMALLLGPAGVGMMGLYMSVSDVTRSVAGMGINSSGVRQIAAAVGSGDADRIARTAAVLRRVSLVLGALGAALLLLLSGVASRVTFGTTRQAGGVALLSVVVLFSLISAGQQAYIQGLRRITDLARMRIIGAILGCVASIVLVYFFRENGLVPSLIAVAATGIMTSWWYSRKARVQAPRMTLAEVAREAVALLKLGFAFMASGFMIMGVAYCIRITVRRQVGYEAVGMYQAAWALSTLYVGFVFQALGDDFYPRLTAVASNNAACNRMVNEQAHVSLLLAGPGILGTLTFAPAVIAAFYSSKFMPAADILQWICLGIALQVVIWPIGYIVLAKGAHRVFFWTELAWTVVHIGLAQVLVHSFGVRGAGMAFFGSYVFHGVVIYPFIRKLSGFTWSPENWKTGSLFLASIGVVFMGFQVLPQIAATGLGAVVCVLACLYSLRSLLELVDSERMPRSIRGCLVRMRFLPARPSLA